MNNVSFTVLKRQFDLHQNEYENAAIRALRSGWYVLGKELRTFESSFSEYMGMKFGIGVNSGQDALILAVRALGIGPGDEVIIQANAYIASVLGITENGATPVFVEPDQFYGIDADKIEAAITSRTKAILPVHLYGQMCDMEKISSIARKHNLFVIEDCAQCHGAMLHGKKAGTYSDISCFSFYPTKPLGAMGDAGMLLTNDNSYDEKLRMLRFYGSKVKYVNEITGINTRMDEIQAAILGVGLQYLEEGNQRRTQIAQRYLDEISNSAVILPQVRTGCTHVYHIFAVRARKREMLQRHMEACGVQTQVHYPIPPHLSPCYAELGYKRGDFPITEMYADEEISLPIYVGMTDEEVSMVIEAVNSFEK